VYEIMSTPKRMFYTSLISEVSGHTDRQKHTMIALLAPLK